ncbi:tRNA uracil 4-sulfurtransferase ThiI [Coxiella burnetii]|uniref:tRNA uracil 4-sulfurtransferase ThiI n=1 Tax=Coxiella burnetii TaxID=777 RepID=UPI00222F81A6|nr:tRNA uracil 4-sulfurtransferase ThiI [Coxiella burnetii]
MKKVILIKYGEIALKGKNRHLFESSIIENIRLAIGEGAPPIEQCRGRLYLQFTTEKDISCYREALKRVFGVVGFALAYRLNLEINLEEMEEVLIKHLRKLESKSLAFRVDTRRTVKSFPMDSMEINKKLGALILQHFPKWQVNLNNPELTIFIEVRDEGLFIYTTEDHKDGLGGLPVGVGGRGLLLLSGGIDSPVAGWTLLKRGMMIDAVYFHSFPYTGEKAKEKVIDLARVLTSWKLRAINLHIPYFTKIQETVNKMCPESTWTIIHRRFMMRIAEKLTKSTYHTLITGENLGQVASQTIQNIAVINQATNLPILRPLISFDKNDIIKIAEKIGTFRISKRPYEDCCALFAPKNPETKANEEAILKAEENLPLNELINEALEKMETLRIKN